MIENLGSKRYEPPSIDLENKNDSRSLIIELSGINKRILEVGTSTGYISKILKQRGNKVIGCEIDVNAAKLASQFCESMIVGDIEDINLDEYVEASSIDVVIFGDVLEHLKKPGVLLKKVKKYLKQDGYLVVSLPNVCHGDVLLNLLSGDFRYMPMGLLDETHLRFFGRKNIINIFNKCGYTISDVRTVSISIGNTELKLDSDRFPQGLVNFIKALPDSDVYQFIFKATPTEIPPLTVAAPGVDLNKIFAGAVDAQIASLLSQLQQANARELALNLERTEMMKSIIWWMTMRFDNCFIERLLPQGSSRRRYYKLGLKGGKILVNEGWKSLWRNFRGYIGKKEIYQKWIETNEPSEVELANQRQLSQQFKYRPLISIITPAYNTPPTILERAIKSVIDQSYDKWELCLTNGNPNDENVIGILEEYSQRDSRVKFKLLNDNLGISGNSNEAMKMAIGEFIAFLDHDDELSPFALYEVINLLNISPDIDIFYSDEDKIDENGIRSEPFFKPDWSFPMFLSTNYLCHFFVCRKLLIDGIKGFRNGFEGAQDYDLILRLIEKTTFDKIVHIPKVLYHWRSISTSVASGRTAKPYAYEAGKKALQNYLARNLIEGSVFEAEDPGSYIVKKYIKGNPKVGIIILKKDSVKICNDYISKLISYTLYKNYTIYLEELPGLRHENNHIEKFDSYNNLINNGCRYFIFINGDALDVDLFSNNSNWIEALIEHFDYFHAGVVGTGSPVYSNIICNVDRPCGPIFCTRQEIVKLCLNNSRLYLFDDLQIYLSDQAELLGYKNIFTPHSLGNLTNTINHKKYYLGLNNSSFLTSNMKYYYLR